MNIQRIYVVWDRFFQDNLKSQKLNNRSAEVSTRFSVMKKYQITGQHFSVAVIAEVNCFQFYQLS